jgi:hypothetical protein
MEVLLLEKDQAQDQGVPVEVMELLLLEKVLVGVPQL